MTDDLQIQKALAEVEKLRTESRFIRWGFYSQIFNMIIVFLSAMIILIYFQRPQNDQLASNRQADQEMRISSLIATAYEMEDKNSQVNLLKALTANYPDHRALRAALDYAEAAKKSSDDLSRQPATISSGNSATKDAECNALIKQISDLESAYAKKRVFETQFISGKSLSGPILDFDSAKNEFDKMVSAWRARSKRLGCSR